MSSTVASVNRARLSAHVETYFPIALLGLVALNGKAMIRRSLRGARTLRGAAFLTVGALMLATWLGFFRVYNAGGTEPDTVRTLFPMWLLGICVLNLVTSAGERAVAFAPAEVDFLFPAPFTRQQLLAYKLLKSAVGAVVTTVLFSILFQRYLQSWTAGGIGIFLSLLLLQLVSMSVVLIAETLGGHAHTRARKAVVGVMLAIVAIACLPLIRAGRERSAADLMMDVASTSAGRVILRPFAPFGELIAAPRLAPDAMLPLLQAVLVLAGLVVLVLWLDARNLEWAARAAHRAYARIGPMRLHGPRRSLPRLPRFGGAGPIAWRQLTTAARQSRAVVLVLTGVCVALGPALYAVGAAERGRPAALLIATLFCVNFVFANALRFDFRGDLDQLDVLKSLPLRPTAIVVAQLVAPTLVLTLCQTGLFLGAGWFLPLEPRLVLAGPFLAAPLNALLFAIENLLFLVFPVRTWATSAGDLQGVGRRMTTFLAKSSILMVGCTIATTVGLIVGRESPFLFLVATSGVLALETLALLPLMMAAFRRLDPSSYAPL